MWIASKLGFFSIVQKEGCYHVRARARQDLVNLCRKVCLRNSLIEEWPDADYRWRLRVDYTELSGVFEALTDSIDYPNFKNQVAADPGQAPKLPAYSQLWSSIHRLQQQQTVDGLTDDTSTASPIRRGRQLR